ncbi:hypothetical protein ACFQVA_04785 [Actinomadura keratinilytica]
MLPVTVAVVARVAVGLLLVGVARRRVVRRDLPGVPLAGVLLPVAVGAAVLALLGLALLRVSLLLGVALLVRVVLLTRVPLLGVLLLRVALLAPALRVLLVRLPVVAGLRGRVAAGLLSAPSVAVPALRRLPVGGRGERVLLPRIGALAPAILSHRSPRARDGEAAAPGAASTPSLLPCASVLRTHRRIARHVTVSRSDDHFDALTWGVA